MLTSRRVHTSEEKDSLAKSAKNAKEENYGQSFSPLAFLALLARDPLFVF